MGIRNLARIHEKEIIGKPKNFSSSVSVCALLAHCFAFENQTLRQRSFLLLDIGVESDLPAIQVASL